MVDRHEPSQTCAKKCRLVTVTSPANLELKNEAPSSEKRCPVTLAKSVPTANEANDNLIADWEDAKVASEGPKNWRIPPR